MSLPKPTQNQPDTRRPLGTVTVSKREPAARDSQETGKKVTHLTPEGISAEFRNLESSPKGLSSAEAEERIKKYGLNAIKAQEESRWQKLLRYFWGPIPWMIEIAALISLLRRDWVDFAVIMGLLLYNAAIGFWQDNKAASALAALKKSLAHKARVMRDGGWAVIDAVNLVPGDVVSVNAGEILPADMILTQGEYLSVDQSALTGESLPVTKTPGDQAYSGSIARRGTMTGLVTSTGEATFFGRTAKLVAGAGTKSHAERAVLRIGDFLILLAGVLAAILIGVRVYSDILITHSWSWDAAGRIAQFVLVLLIASIPVAMPAVMSVTMALGALKLSKQKAILSRLSAISELAGVDVLCSDKTGTLTMNKLTLDAPISFGATGNEIITAASLATQPQSEDAIDQAVLSAMKDTTLFTRYKQTGFTPFDPVHKMTVSTVTPPEGQTQKYAKGAPQAISALCGMKGAALDKYNSTVSELAGRGYRALGVAKSDDAGKTWTMLGILPLMDPPRPDAKETVAQTKKLGLAVKMVTGDDVAIGDEIAYQLGLGHHLVAAVDIFDKKNDADHAPIDIERAVERADGFARVFPQHKYEIVKALQARGHIVAMTGDGVNDAPALKQADCGIAVSGATDAARDAAALILTAPGLSTIVNAVVEARQIFQRITSYVYYRIAMTLDLMFVVVISSLAFGFQPLTAIMIIALALLDDIPIMTIAYDNTVVSPKPIRWNMHRIIVFSSLMGLLALVQSFGILWLGMYWTADANLTSIAALNSSQLQTVLFLQLAAGGHLLLLVVRTPYSIFRPPYPSWQLLLAIVATQIVAVLMCGFGVLVPSIPWVVIGLVWAYVLVWMLIIDAVKCLFFWEMDRRESETAVAEKPVAAV
jgi:H+-transporting ATPase